MEKKFQKILDQYNLLNTYLADPINLSDPEKLAKFSQEKSELVKEIIPILNDVQNPIIQSEYVKIVATALSLDDKALQQDVRKASRADFIINHISHISRVC